MAQTIELAMPIDLAVVLGGFASSLVGFQTETGIWPSHPRLKIMMRECTQNFLSHSRYMDLLDISEPSV